MRREEDKQELLGVESVETYGFRSNAEYKNYAGSYLLMIYLVIESCSQLVGLGESRVQAETQDLALPMERLLLEVVICLFVARHTQLRLGIP